MLISVKYHNKTLFLLGRQIGFEEICFIKHWKEAHWLNIFPIKTVYVHIPLITTYKDIKKKTEKDSGKTPVKRKKISRQSYYWNRQCLFCGGECSIEIDKKNPQGWKESFKWRTSDRDKGRLSFKQVILLVRKSVITWMLIVQFNI